MKKIISKFKPLSGWHCVSNSLKQIFHYNNIKISEEMLFGLSSALNFFYFEFKNNPTPVIGGRNKIGNFEDNLAEALGIKIKSHETASKKKAYENLTAMLELDQPVMIYVDMAYLPYLNIPDNYHFGGHSIVVFGIDEEEGISFISDRDGKGFRVTLNDDEKPDDYHILSLENLALARSSKEKPFPPKNRWVTFDFSAIKEITQPVIHKAILKNIEVMKNPPIKNLGLNGIELFSTKMADWNEFDNATLKWSAIDSFFMINKVGGNGGGCFRRMYGNFLKQSGELIKDDFLEVSGNEYIKISNIWDCIADNFYKIYQICDRNLLKVNAEKLFLCYIREKELMTRIEEHIKEL